MSNEAYRAWILAAVSALALTACSDTGFLGSSGAKKEGEKEEKDPVDEVTDDADDPDDEESDSDTDKDQDDDNDTATDDEEEDEIKSSDGTVIGDVTKCWFAVSGAYLGYGGNGSPYASTWPLPNDNGPIGHNKRFDSVGGAFLIARKEPYVYKQGAGEIDAAVDDTFDSIAVAPGMSVEIKSDTGVVMYSGDGPYIAYANDHHESLDTHPGIQQGLAAKMPPWMKTHFESINWTAPLIPLHAARSVKVTKIPGKSCD